MGWGLFGEVQGFNFGLRLEGLSGLGLGFDPSFVLELVTCKSS